MRVLPSISKLIASFRKEQAHLYIPDLWNLPSVSAAKIIQELDLETEGRNRGLKDLPKSDDDFHDPIEIKIHERLHSLKKEALLTARERLATYESRLSALDFSGRLSAINYAVHTLPSEFDMEARNGRNRLNRHREELKNKTRDYYGFRNRHKIEREPVHETGGFVALRYALLFALLITETIVNGKFLSVTNQAGLLGGIMEAVIFALLNILVSFGVAVFGIRKVNESAISSKLIGAISILFYIIFALTINLALAHYREGLALSLPNAGQIVVEKMRSAPLSLVDVKSWLFFTAGVAFSAIAVADGLFLYDPIPGYGRLFERKKKANVEYEEEVRNLCADLKELQDNAIEALEQAGRDLEKRRGEYVSILSGKQNLELEYDKFQDSIDKLAEALYSVYRSANREARRSREPRRFSVHSATERLALTSENFPIDSHLDEKIELARKQMDELVQKLRSAYDSAYKSYTEIDDILGDYE